MADMQATATFASVAVTLYAAHHVGDYWVQTDRQARHKGDAGQAGRDHCLAHVGTYLLTQALFLALLTVVTGLDTSPVGLVLGLAVSGVTHYLADRREHGVMLRLARAVGLAAFLKLGVPRTGVVLCQDSEEPGIFSEWLDNPQLATGGWALDQAWHIFWGVFVAALIIAGLS